MSRQLYKALFSFQIPLFLCLSSFVSLELRAQASLQEIIKDEHQKGRFNGVALLLKGDTIDRAYQGFANFQFEVAIAQKTRFPIASMSKLFTALAILQLQEQEKLTLNDEIGQFIFDLPSDCQHITIRDLLVHRSGLENEPIRAVTTKFTLDEYIQTFVKRLAANGNGFNYNNVDYILLSKIIETVTNSPFDEAMSNLILRPLDLADTGFVRERNIIKNLAYGYHNYSFGEGDPGDPLFNDRRYISNYHGAGAMYSTPEDLLTLLFAIRDNKLVSQNTKQQFLLCVQDVQYVDWLGGKPTFGFYFDPKKQVYRRSGNIDGFNAQIITNSTFDKILIVLCNTDTADLSNLSNKVYFGE